MGIDECVAVDAPPATGWHETRPEGLDPQLWAHARPTDEVLARLSLPDGAAVHGRDGRLLGWESASDVGGDLGELWLRCARMFPRTGLWPVCNALDIDPVRRWWIVEGGWHARLARSVRRAP